MLPFSAPLTKLPKIGTKISAKLSRLGIETVEDLLYHFPHRYEDYSNFKNINQLEIGEQVTLQGKIEDIQRRKTWKRKMMITEVFINDQTGSIKAVWFNLSTPTQFLTQGNWLRLSGKVTLTKQNEPVLQHPHIEFIKKPIASPTKQENKSSLKGSLMPIYPETRKLTSYWFRRTLKNLLKQVIFEDPLPQAILKSQKLLGIKTALEQIHFPASQKLLSASKNRFAFEKMFLAQVKTVQIKKEWEDHQAIPIAFNKKEIQAFLKTLPFKLTSAQKKTAWQIIKDLEKTRPMNRLLEGDVGTGKTIVAALAIFSVLNSQRQVAFLAPTEVLAIQHYQSLKKIFSPFSFEVALLTASQAKINKDTQTKNKTKKDILNKLAKHKSLLVIGTHALLQKKVSFSDLALVIIDEQHRFGVKQRAFLQQKTSALDDGSKKTIPHLLTMTATPIPRTLSLAIFGNLDISIIDEFPRGRKKIITQVVHPTGREQVYAFIKKEILNGRQAFIICPLVEESSKITEVKAATEEFKRLQTTVFPQFNLGLLHGKKKPQEKNDIMQQFKNKKLDILVATSVVEVGVDIPNATIMLIEGAERFGLSQLHQFRGRVGRSQYQSYCFLFTTNKTPTTTSRLRALEKTNNGFKIAEADLKLRGPGQFMGTAQSGLPDITMEALSDVKLIQAARLEAQRVIAFDPNLKKFPRLKKQLDNMTATVHME